jgi:hypothetical protein
MAHLKIPLLGGLMKVANSTSTNTEIQNHGWRAAYDSISIHRDTMEAYAIALATPPEPDPEFVDLLARATAIPPTRESIRSASKRVYTLISLAKP